MDDVRRSGRRASLVIALWVAVWLIVIDVALNLALVPRDPRTEPSTLQRYFEYGRSIEGKLDRMVRADPKGDGAILASGWLDAAYLGALPARPAASHDRLIAAYGQSFTMHAAHEAAQRDGRLTVRAVGGPGAPPSHAYAGYLVDAPRRRADVVVFGVLSSTVVNMGSLSGLAWSFEHPAPFTFPRWRLEGERLVAEEPLLRNEAQFRAAFTSRSETWVRFKGQLRRDDRGYDPLSFEGTVADASAIVRLLRRGWVAHHRPYEQGVWDPATGFDPEAEELRVLRAMLLDLAGRTRERGERLVVLLLHTKGHGAQLHAALGPTLGAAGIDYISTHSLFSADDPSNFVRDGHYSAAANGRLAEALRAKIRAAPLRNAQSP